MKFFSSLYVYSFWDTKHAFERLIIYVKSLTSNLSRCFNFIIWNLKILKGLQSSFQLGIIIISRIILIWFQKNKEQKKKKII